MKQNMTTELDMDFQDTASMNVAGRQPQMPLYEKVFLIVGVVLCGSIIGLLVGVCGAAIFCN